MFVRPIRMIYRQKLAGPGKHYGVQLPNGNVAHRTVERGDHVVSYEEFAQNLEVRTERVADANRHWEVLARVRQSIGRSNDYRLADNNCEHYANWLMGDKPQSLQVQLAVIAAVVAGVFWFAQ